MSEKKAKRGRSGRSRRSDEHDVLSRDASSSQGFAPINQTSPPSATAAPSPRFPPSSIRVEQGNRIGIAPASAGAAAESSPSVSTVGPQRKIAIPAIRRDPEPTKKQERKIRTSHACENCRKSKAGCSGEQPCSRCRTARLQCVYGDGKRDKERKRISKLSRDAEILNQHSVEVNDALRRIRDDETLSLYTMRAALDAVLSMTPRPLSPDDGDMSASAFASGRMSSERDDAGSDGEFDAAAEVGSTGSLDVIEIDADKDETRATGHIGKSSSVTWAKRTAMELNTARDQEGLFGTKDSGLAIASYHTEDADVESVDTSGTDPYEWPEVNLSLSLVDMYFKHVHHAFPAIEKTVFLHEYKTFPKGSRNISREQKIWLAMLNTMWGISAFYARLAKKQYGGHPNDHLFFVARAKALHSEAGVVYEDARISTVSSLALLSLYYIGTNRLNRAWTLCGLGIRHALTLGLHVRQMAKDMPDIEKEHRVRLWWSLYTLECSLNELTGRPSCISDRDISTPLPINVDEDEFHGHGELYKRTEHTSQGSDPGSVGEISTRKGSDAKSSLDSRKRSYLSLTDIMTKEPRLDQEASSQRPRATQPLAFVFPVLQLPITSSTYFIYRTQLALVSHEIVTQLYSASTNKQKWSDVQETIRRIDYRLLAWRENLPKAFDISFDTTPEPDWSDPLLLARTGLAMLFNSSRMILFRPCLCRFEGRLATQSSKSKDFNQDAVLTCIRSARKMISLIRWSASSAEKLYAIEPWWTTLHYLCEALSVLMLEMAFQAQHLPEEVGQIFADAKDGIRWLSMMADQSVSARKAWEIFDSLIRLVAPSIQYSTDDIPTDAPVPQGFNWRRFNNAVPSTQQAPIGQQLTSANLQQYAGTQVPLPHTAATSAWATVNQDPMLNMESFGSAPPQAEYEMVSNPLDPTTALQRFSAISIPHGHYDEPWHQYFLAEPGRGFATTGTTSGVGMEDADMADIGDDRPYFTQSGYQASDTFGPVTTGGAGYTNMTPTTAPSVLGYQTAYQDPQAQFRQGNRQGDDQGSGAGNQGGGYDSFRY